jgi:hypothetical protein
MRLTKNLQLAQFNQNSKVNKNRVLRRFKVGDTAYLKHPNRFNKGYCGPFFIKKVLSPVIVVIQEYENPSAPCMKRHINLLHWAPPRKPVLNSSSNVSHPNSSLSPVLIDHPADPPLEECEPMGVESDVAPSDVAQPDSSQPEESEDAVPGADPPTEVLLPEAPLIAGPATHQYNLRPRRT